MPTMKQVSMNGRTVLIPDEPDPGHQNPPLQVLNEASREADVERRDRVREAVGAASGAMTTALLGRDGRRAQKPLAPNYLPKKVG